MRIVQSEAHVKELQSVVCVCSNGRFREHLDAINCLAKQIKHSSWVSFACISVHWNVNWESHVLSVALHFEMVMIKHFELLIVFYMVVSLFPHCAAFKKGFKYSAIALRVFATQQKIFKWAVNGIMGFNWCVQNDEWDVVQVNVKCRSSTLKLMRLQEVDTFCQSRWMFELFDSRLITHRVVVEIKQFHWMQFRNFMSLATAKKNAATFF